MESNSNEINLKEIQTESLQKIVTEHLDRMDLDKKIKEIADLENDSEEEVIKKIKESGLINEIMNEFKNDPKSPFENSDFPKNKLGLLIKLEQGHNFIDYDPSNNLSEEHSVQYFQFDVQFCGQRFQTKRIPTSGDFNINETFLMDFNPLNYDVELTYNILKKNSTPVHIVLLLIDTSGNKRMISSKSIEWRWALCYGSWKIEVDLKSPNSLNSVNVGSVEMSFSLMPLVNKSLLLTQSSIRDQVNEEKKIEIEKNQDFINYSKMWWEDYKGIRPCNANRIVKIFLPTEDREYYAFKPATSLIESIEVGRAINTPYEAARFVSLIPFERRENPGGEKIELWHSVHTFLSVGKGDTEDHVVLLCDLLLGFGLDAYVAVGVAVNGPHLWVITRAKLANNKYSVIFWESLTGQRISVDDPKIFRFYKQIHCLFNNENFYASIQKDDNVFNTIYNLEDESLWKQMDKEKIKNLTKFSIVPLLDIIQIDKYKVETDIEKLLRMKVTKFRAGNDLPTQWDNKLSHLLSPALVNYEMERVSNLTYGNEEFKSSVKNYVPEGFTFKAFPFQINDINCEKIFGMILSNDIGKDILNQRGDQVKFAIRVKLYAYPQGVYSLWIMFATKFRPIK
ncbi:MAG: hypothetical protein MJ252_17785 [archaeon]|nr:hypothetical protein [archaeon]